MGSTAGVPFRHDAGILLELAAAPRRSGVARVTLHDGLAVRPAGDATLLVTARAARVFWCAFYAPAVMQNGWEPYDQPNPAAYLPLSFNELERIELGQAGAFVFERWPRHQNLQTTAVDDGLARRCEFLGLDRVPVVAQRLEEFLSAVGVPAQSVGRCVEAVLSRTCRAQSSGQVP